MAQSSDKESENDLTDHRRTNAPKRQRLTLSHRCTSLYQTEDTAPGYSLSSGYKSHDILLCCKTQQSSCVENQIQTLEQQVKKYESKSAQQPATAASSAKKSTGKQKEMFTDEETERLIYARTALDHEYNQHIQIWYNHQQENGKWYILFTTMGLHELNCLFLLNRMMIFAWTGVSMSLQKH